MMMRVKHAAKALARHLGKFETMKAINGRVRHVRGALAGDEPIAITVTFRPPDRHHRDDDNMMAAFKSARNGIADALQINDRRFRPTYKLADPVKPGRIEVVFL